MIQPLPTTQAPTILKYSVDNLQEHKKFQEHRVLQLHTLCVRCINV